MPSAHLDLQQELQIMRLNYINKPLKRLRLRKPSWLAVTDRLSIVFREKETLLREGKIYYAHVVQANEMLFMRDKARNDCPANFIYSADGAVNDDPAKLASLAHTLFSYKGKNLDDVPPEWQRMAGILTDEFSREGHRFTIQTESGPAQMNFVCVLVFREMLPKRTLLSSLVPVIAAPEKCESILILPKKYWTKNFTAAWENGEL